ncbi:MAG: class I SAM-dependent methyltransferase [Pedobacter sp.]|nr:MAG: class I SAM-dependent methyltransferase [Pedobacter sp.]
MNKNLDYYNNNAEQFFEQTYQVDMHSLYQQFLEHVPQGGSILDLGCGSGRDALAFKNMGYRIEATDYSSELVEKARKLTGLNVRLESFYELSETNKYHGIWACASLLHCQREQLSSVIKRMLNALKSAGVIYMSFKYGADDREAAGRSFTDLDDTQAEALLEQFDNVTLIRQWITFDQRPDRSEQWLNVLIKKLD